MKRIRIPEKMERVLRVVAARRDEEVADVVLDLIAALSREDLRESLREDFAIARQVASGGTHAWHGPQVRIYDESFSILRRIAYFQKKPIYVVLNLLISALSDPHIRETLHGSIQILIPEYAD